MKFLIVAAKTGGHVFPAATVSKKLINNDHQIILIGTGNKIEINAKFTCSYGFPQVFPWVSLGFSLGIPQVFLRPPLRNPHVCLRFASDFSQVLP